MNGPVLVTGARAPVALDIARAFAAGGHSVRLADSVTPWAARMSRSRWAIDRLPPPRHAFRAFSDVLQRLVERHRVELIVPTCEEVFYVAAAAAVGGYADRVFAPPLATLRLLHSKYSFPAFSREQGIAAPDTWLITDPAQIQGLPLPLEQLVLKPEFSRFALSALIRPNRQAMARVRATREHPWVAQRFVAGEEICLWSAARDGRITAVAAYRPRWRHGRSAAYAFEAIDCPAAEQVARHVAAATGMTGHLSFDMILTADGTAVPIECNPRAVSGVHLFADDARLARAIADDAVGEALRPPATLRYLAPAMALLGLPAALGERWPDYVADWRRGADAISRPGDRLPLAGTLIDAARFALVGLSRRRSPTGATTDDIEWNGEAIA